MSGMIKRKPDGSAFPRPPGSEPVSERPPVSPGRSSGLPLFTGLAIAMIADALDVAFPMLSLPMGFLTAILLSLIFGVRWETFVVLIPESLPVTAMFPTWVILVFYLAGIKR